MNKEATIKAWLDDIRLSQEDAFEYDEMAILSAYKKNENNQDSRTRRSSKTKTLYHKYQCEMDDFIDMDMDIISNPLELY